ncbi:MAG: ABC transporter ATP-binding protein, partial [Thermus sp.]|nr:ABC transporter ATP-binding protein [Thermus sp.]
TWTARFLGHKNLLSPEESQALGLPARPHLLPRAALRLGEGPEGVVEERLFFGSRVGFWIRLGRVRVYLEALDPLPHLQEGAQVTLGLDLSQAVPLEG